MHQPSDVGNPVIDLFADKTYQPFDVGKQLIEAAVNSAKLRNKNVEVDSPFRNEQSNVILIKLGPELLLPKTKHMPELALI